MHRIAYTLLGFMFLMPFVASAELEYSQANSDTYYATSSEVYFYYKPTSDYVVRQVRVMASDDLSQVQILKCTTIPFATTSYSSCDGAVSQATWTIYSSDGLTKQFEGAGVTLDDAYYYLFAFSQNPQYATEITYFMDSNFYSNHWVYCKYGSIVLDCGSANSLRVYLYNATSSVSSGQSELDMSDFDSLVITSPSEATSTVSGQYVTIDYQYENYSGYDSVNACILDSAETYNDVLNGADSGCDYDTAVSQSISTGFGSDSLVLDLGTSDAVTKAVMIRFARNFDLESTEFITYGNERLVTWDIRTIGFNGQTVSGQDFRQSGNGTYSYIAKPWPCSGSNIVTDTASTTACVFSYLFIPSEGSLQKQIIRMSVAATSSFPLAPLYQAVTLFGETLFEQSAQSYVIAIPFPTPTATTTTATTSLVLLDTSQVSSTTYPLVAQVRNLMGYILWIAFGLYVLMVTSTVFGMEAQTGFFKDSSEYDRYGNRKK